MAPLRLAVSGSSGLIGQALVAALESEGHFVHRIVREDPDAKRGDIELARTGTEQAAQQLDGCDAVVHLAGKNIATRWTAAAKAEILRSRTEGTARLAEAIARLAHPPRCFVGASAIGYYGDRGDEVVDESSPAGTGFLADVVRAWEAATTAALRRGSRVVSVRFGVVLARDGGALRKMLPAFRLGAGGRIGNGRQWMSWVALDDAVRAIRFAIERETLAGPVNVTAPNPVRNAEFAQTLGKVLRRPAVLPLPAAIVRTVFGEMGESVLLAGQRVRAARLADAGFEFRYETLENALRHELERPR